MLKLKYVHISDMSITGKKVVDVTALVLWILHVITLAMAGYCWLVVREYKRFGLLDKYKESLPYLYNIVAVTLTLVIATLLVLQTYEGIYVPCIKLRKKDTTTN